MRYPRTIKGIFAGAVAAVTMMPGLANAEAFNGPYAGAEVGLGALKSTGSTLAGPFKETNETIVIGAIAGYHVSLGENFPFVLGTEGGVGVNTDGGDPRFMVSGISGLKIGGKALVYGRAGYAWNHELSKDTENGLVLGGGAELAINEHMRARLEYRHIDYGEITFPDNTADYNGHEIMAGVFFNF